MLCEVRIIDGRRFISQDEALSILAEGPYECQLYEVINWIGATGTGLTLRALVSWWFGYRAKRKIDVMDALFLALELRFRLLCGMKTHNGATCGFR
jgi:hypothetical protein